LQLTHSGRYCKPNSQQRAEPRILYRHPILDRRLGLPSDFPLLTDEEIGGIIEEFHCAARIAAGLGFDFVDIKHCHGYLGHEFLSAHTREGKYGGSLANRARFLREVVQGIRAAAPQLKIGVRVSAFDSVPFHPDPAQSVSGKSGPGIPEPHADLLPYRWGFGVNASDPTQPDLAEPIQFLSLLESLNIFLVNVTAGSPYYSPHIQRPALYPPSDGYLPPEDPLVGVARQMEAARELKRRFPNLLFVGTAYSYLQDFLPHVAASHPHAADTPVILITDDQAELPHHHVLINLSGQTPAHFARFERMFEIISAQEEDKIAGRDRYRYYKDRGYPLTHFVAQAV